MYFCIYLQYIVSDKTGKKLNLTYDSLKTFNYSEIQNWNPKIQHK